MKRISILLTFLILGITLTRAEEPAAEFSINIWEMNPVRYPSHTVDAGYSLTLRNDTVQMYLPYMGEVYQPEFSNDGLDMVQPVYNLTSALGKKGRRIISFRCRRGFVEYLLHVTLFHNGKATVHLQPSNAQSISYTGELVSPQPVTPRS